MLNFILTLCTVFSVIEYFSKDNCLLSNITQEANILNGISKKDIIRLIRWSIPQAVTVGSSYRTIRQIISE